ncbi:hypothetical protein EON83_08445 [bacterium]|nr:MAG: hypothetical protein EON83_08445 [bacterium]
MKMMFCWRCQMDMAMLDEEEYAVIRELYFQGITATKESRQQRKLPLEKLSIEEYFQPLLRRYHELTGREETVPNAVMHHRISLYGPPCKQCGKPLRTPQALFCAACGENA